MRRLGSLLAVLWLAGGLARAGVGVWTTSGPAGAGFGVVTDPRIPGVVYAGAQDGIYRSGDEGASWTLTSLRGGPYTAVAIAADSTVYAMGPYVAENGAEVALFSSSDGGANWAALTFGDFGTSYVLAVGPGLAGNRYLYTNFQHGLADLGGLSRSSDGGITWTTVGSGLAKVTLLAVAPNAPSTLYADTIPHLYVSPPEEFGLTKSLDSGSTWTLIPNAPTDIDALAVDPGNANVVYIAAGSAGILKSTDGGAHFEPSSQGLTSLSVSSFSIDPLRPERLYAATQAGVYVSSDAGATWNAMAAGLTTTTLRALAIDPAGKHLHVATLQGVFDVEIVENQAVLTLNAAHPFTVTLSATDQRTGRTGAGVATAVNDLWGWFSIPAITSNPNNPEVFVKLLDGTAINGEYWFFYGGLTDLEYTLTVTDDTTGATKTYTKPAGSECGGSDTAAFTP